MNNHGLYSALSHIHTWCMTLNITICLSILLSIIYIYIIISIIFLLIRGRINLKSFKFISMLMKNIFYFNLHISLTITSCSRACPCLVLCLDVVPERRCINKAWLNMGLWMKAVQGCCSAGYLCCKALAVHQVFRAGGRAGGAPVEVELSCRVAVRQAGEEHPGG